MTVLKTIANVPIVTTGTYHLGSNAYDAHETTFTSDDLRDAVAAVQDPGVRLPRLKLGHTAEWGDAEPAFGKVDNLRYDEEDQTVYGDYVGTPAWLAEVMPAIYPNRSVEAMFNVTTETGNEYRMVITAVSLLGVILPGVATLEDLAGLYTDEVPEDVELEGEAVVASLEGGGVGLLKRRKAEASTNLEDVRRAFYEEWAIGDQFYYWIREVFIDPEELIVDDGDGNLVRMSFNVSGDSVEFGDPQAVKVQYVDAAAGERPVIKVPELRSDAAMAFASRSESRPESTEEDQVDALELRTKLGLPADAPDEDVTAALDRLTAETPPTGDPEPEPNGDEDSEDDGTQPPTPQEPQPVEPEQEPAGAVANGGTVTIDSATLAQLQAGAKAGLAAAEVNRVAERERFLTQACKDDRKFPPSRMEHWSASYDADPEGTRQVIEAMPKDLIPVEEIGVVPSEGDLSDADRYAHRAWMSPGEVARASGTGGVPAGTITQEA